MISAARWLISLILLLGALALVFIAITLLVDLVRVASGQPSPATCPGFQFFMWCL